MSSQRTESHSLFNSC